MIELRILEVYEISPETTDSVFVVLFGNGSEFEIKLMNHEIHKNSHCKHV